MKSKRSERRHHIERLRNKRKNYWGGRYRALTDRELGILVSTPKVNDCLCCSNPRRSYGEKTIQEKKAEQEYK